MKSKQIKITVLIFIVILTASFLMNCGESQNTDSGNSTSPAETNSDSNSGNAAGENPEPENLSDSDSASLNQSSVEERPDYDLPAEDLENYNFRILSRNGANPGWGNTEFSAEQENGDPINDAAYKRDKAVESTYNVELSNIPSDDVNAQATKSIKAGSDDFDAVVVGFNYQQSLITSGLLMNLAAMPYIDLSNRWWDQRAVEQLAIYGRLYAASGDLTIRDKDSIAIFMFNKKLVGDYEFGNLYELVLSGKWTFAKMFDMMKAVSKDLNGDGVIDGEDQLGLTTAVDYGRFLFNASGETMGRLNAEKMPEITLYSERAASVCDMIRQIQGDANYSINVDSAANSSKYTDIWAMQNAMFAENRALFLHGRMSHVTVLRDMESDFGILPPPKFNEEQEEYHATVGTWTASAVSVPITVPTPEKTGLILEALTYESRYTLLPAYYDINLKTKFARDDESKEMIDIILSSRIYDIGELYAWGDVTSYFTGIAQGKNDSLSTYWEKNSSKIEAAMQKTLNQLGSFE